MAQSEYEVITHNSGQFNLFLVSLLYRTPHLHREFEISLVLEGTVRLTTPNGHTTLSAGEAFLMNPFCGHELLADAPVLILSLQISPSFFAPYYPQIERIVFQRDVVESPQVGSLLIALASAYFAKGVYSPLECAALLNQIFFELLQTQAHHTVSERERQSALSKENRMRSVLQYIEAHYTEKLLLSDIAEQEGLDLFYLSHYFKECFGIPFQSYVLKLRCEHARQKLLRTGDSLLSIGISCGFSDPKYFNKGFLAQYGCTPRAYQENFQAARLEQQQQSLSTTQAFLSDDASLAILRQREPAREGWASPPSEQP